MEDEQARRWAEEKRRQIELGLRLELLDSIPEGLGDRLIDELKKSLETKDKKAVLATLKKIGDTIHARWGLDQPSSQQYENISARYIAYLSSGTGGTRLIINTMAPAAFPGDLIFPNVNLGHRAKDGRTLADVFEELFGKSAENIQPKNDKPYYVVRITSAKDKK
jgi:hypothetical protein